MFHRERERERDDFSDFIILLNIIINIIDPPPFPIRIDFYEEKLLFIGMSIIKHDSPKV